MTTTPVQRSDATPEVIGDPIAAAEAVVNDPSKNGSAEWLAAKQLLANESRAGQKDAGGFTELEREMQALRGMSEI